MKNMHTIQTILATAFLAFAITAQAADRYWVATSATNWNSTANWSETSGGSSGASVPGNSDIAIFDGTNSATGDCTIDMDVEVLHLSILTGYSGTIAMGTYNVTVGDVSQSDDPAGNGTFTQQDGTFTGGAGKFMTRTFLLDGGTFNAPEDFELNINRGRDLTVLSVAAAGASFSQSSGKARLYSKINANARITHSINLNGGSLSLGGDFEIVVGGTWNTTSGRDNYLQLGTGDTIIVPGDLHIHSVVDGGGITERTANLDGGKIQVHGDVAFGMESAGSNNRFVGGTATVELIGAGDQYYTYGGNIVQAPRFSVDKPSGAVHAAEDVDMLNVEQFLLKQGTFNVATNGILQINEGNGEHITVFEKTGGTYESNDGTLSFKCRGGPAGNYFKYIKLGGTLAVHHLEFTGGNSNGSGRYFRYWLDAGDKFIAYGNLLMESSADESTNCRTRLEDGSIEVHGNVTVGHPIDGGGFSGEETLVSLVGSADQTLTHYYHAGNTIPGSSLTINKTGGTVTLLSDMNLRRTDQDLTWTAGGLDLGSNTLTVVDNVTIASGATTLGVTVADATTVGNIAVGDNVSGLENVDLEVTVTATPADVEDQTFTILSNDAVVQEFNAVTWQDKWEGTVAYTDNDGKNVTLSDLMKILAGTLLILK